MLSHSPPARPLPAVTLSAVGLDVFLAFCGVGMAMMLWANSHGWSPSPRAILAVVTGIVAVLVNITPTGSADVASYAAYGRIAALGLNPGS